MTGPVFSDITPATASVDNSTNTPIFFRIKDQSSPVNINTVNIAVTYTLDVGPPVLLGNIVNGAIQQGFDPSKTILSPVSGNVDVFLTTLDQFPSGSTAHVSISATDMASNTATLSYSFKIIDLVPPVITPVAPLPNAVNRVENTTIALTYTDPNGDGVDLTSINVTVNGIPAIINGTAQLAYCGATIMPTMGSVIVVISPNQLLPSAARTTVSTTVKDLRGNQSSLTYSFFVRDYMAPQLTNLKPADGYVDILPNTDIRFTIVEDPDGYGVDFSSLSILVDGYSVLLSDGYIVQDGYDVPLGDGYFDGYGVYLQPTVTDGYGNLLYRGFVTTIDLVGLNKYNIIVDPLVDFDFNSTVHVQLTVADLGGHSSSDSYFFHIAPEGTILTTATPDTGTYQNYLDGYGLVDGYIFLYSTGVTFSVNLPNMITYYTIDGSLPSIDPYGNVRGNTKVYTGQPILFQSPGLHVLKFFSADFAGNQESVKQEVYMIRPFPPEARPNQSVSIFADIPFPTTVIPLYSAVPFSASQIVKILDDIRPPIITTILSVDLNATPQFITVKDPVDRLKVSRNARVEIIPNTIDPAGAIKVDPTSLSEFMYIGSDGQGQNQADAVLETMRILNVASTDEEILADFTLLAKNVKFFNQDQPVVLSSNFSALELARSNIPDHTLVLLDFDGTVDNAPRAGVLKLNTSPVVSRVSAGNTVIFRIQVKKSEFVDRELLVEVLQNFAPVDLAIQVEFEEVD